MQHINGMSIVVSNQDKYLDAISWCNRALAIDPNNVVALVNKGLALVYLNNYQDVIDYYDMALAIGPNFTIAHKNKKLALEYLSK